MIDRNPVHVQKQDFLVKTFGALQVIADAEQSCTWHLKDHKTQHTAVVIFGPDGQWWFETNHPGHERDNATGHYATDAELLESSLKEFLPQADGAPRLPVNRRYVHRKTGAIYLVTGMAIDCTNARDGLPVVVYCGLKDNALRIFIREVEEFLTKFELLAEERERY